MTEENGEGVGYNPMSHSSIDAILKKRKEAEHQAAIRKEEEEDYIRAVNRLFSSPDGKLFAKKLIRYCKIYSFDKELNPAKLVEDNGKRKVFLELVRPYLHQSVLLELEN